MRTILPFAPNPLDLQMASASVEGHEHLAPSLASPLNPQELSRPASPQQSNLSLLVSSHHTALRSPPSANLQATLSPISSRPPGSEPAVSIQSILSSNTSPPLHGTQQPSWNGTNMPPQHENAIAGPSSPVQRSSTKRKLDSSEADDPHNKIRRVVREHVSQDPARVMPMTTVLCMHAAVAQKSYGSEKRFLCPPPVVHIEGPVWQLKSQQLVMAVVTETGERGCELKAPMDHNLTASFKFLHVTGSAKSKSFQLSLDIAEPPPSPGEGVESTSPGRVWASFDSAPVTIISKPSKKTAKTRNISSCILAGGPVSLFNRINSQTVRTKYMTIEHGQLCASNVAWSAFNVNVVRQQGETSTTLGGPQPVTYGSEIILSDTATGVQTSPLLIRKVDKGRIAPDDGGPVSQMQKIALQRVNADGTRHYLSAAGPMPGTPGVVVPPAPGLSNQAGTHPLLFQAPRVREEMKEGVRVITDEVDDYLCWTIVGISKFQYTFFDAFGQNNSIPDLPITPFPTLFTTPLYRPSNNTVELTAANFFYEDPKTKAPVPLDVYLGNLGPLRLRIYQTPPTGVLGIMDPFISVPPPPPNPDGTPAPPQIAPVDFPATRHLPSANPHTVVVVFLPPMAEVIKAMEEDALPIGEDASTDTRSPRNGESSASGGKRTSTSVNGRSLPILFIRAFDGVGYHSGRAISAENVFQTMDLSNPAATADNSGWLAAAQAAATVDGGLHGWTLRVI
ncbi:Transcription factor cbf11 [Grifola frondosa]|uniref:Transcription factor cbf11 n=1 Tax=Grifola frondosa TaxID=5627 RepID=A0A1C7MPH3_GRIFR|nr:Transcription factor cbf11 [Grifola frondosa]